MLSANNDTVAPAAATSLDCTIDRTAATATSALLAASITAPNTHDQVGLHPQLIESESCSSLPWPPSSSTLRSSRYVVVMCMCMVAKFVVEYTRAMESIGCQKYWDGNFPGRFAGPIDEKWCKVEPVQAELAMLKGWDVFLSCLSAVLIVVPSGVVANRFSRKVVLCVSLLGLALALTWTQIVCGFSSSTGP